MFKQIQLIILLILSISLVFAGTHPAEQVLSGNFSGNFNFLDGNIGIGITDPTATLDVDGIIQSYSSFPTMRFYDSDATTDAEVGSYISWGGNGDSQLAWLGYGSTSNSDFQIKNKISDGNMIFSTNNAERMRITSAGIVGIGTLAPSSKLDVSGVIRSTSESTIPSSGVGLEMMYYSAQSKSYIQTYNRDSSTYGLLDIEGSSITMNAYSGGNVGIGVTDPDVPLEVSQTNDPTAGTTYLKISNPSSGNWLYGESATGILFEKQGWPTGYIESTHLRDENFADHSNEDAGLAFGTRHVHSEDMSTKMVITNSGRVGIGTTTPSQLLDVAGNIQINSNNLYVDTGLRGIRPISGQYGTIQTTGSGYNGWEGYSIDGNYVFMSKDTTSAGIYNDVNNRWIMYLSNGAYLRFYEPDSGNVAMHIEPDGDLNMNSHRIEGLATPNSDDDAVNKAYVDANAGGTLPPGSIDWSDCEYKGGKVGITTTGSTSGTYSCTSGYVLVDSNCGGTYTSGSATDMSYCYLNGINSIYAYAEGPYNYIGVSIKCCKLVT